MLYSFFFRKDILKYSMPLFASYVAFLDIKLPKIIRHKVNRRNFIQTRFPEPDVHVRKMMTHIITMNVTHYSVFVISQYTIQ